MLSTLSQTSRRLHLLLKIWAANIQLREISYSPPNGLATVGAPNGAGAAAAPLAIVVVVCAVEPNKPPPVLVARQKKNIQFFIDWYFYRPPNALVAVGAPNAVEVGAAAPNIDSLGAAVVADVEPNKPPPVFVADNISC